MDLEEIDFCINDCKNCEHYYNCQDSDYYYEYHSEYNDPFTSNEDWERCKAYLDEGKD